MMADMAHSGSSKDLRGSTTWLALMVVAVSVLLFAVQFRNRIPFGPGPDPLDYISTARQLVRTGRLHFPIDEPEVLGVPGRYAPYFVPEPYVPAADGRSYVSLYPPGTSFLMAALILLMGQRGPFFLGPILAAGCILLVYLLARSWLERRASLAVATLLALSPVFLGPARAPLSDVPALFFWLAGLVLLMRGRGGVWLASSGAFLAFAALIRPNLLVLWPVLLPLGWRPGPAATRVKRFLILGAGAVPCLALQAALNLDLYGSPLKTGYSQAPWLFHLFSAACLPVSLPHWLLGLLMGAGPVTLLMAVAVLIRLRDGRALTAFLLIGLHLSFFSFYCFSGSLRLHRLLLPCLPVLMLLAAGALKWPTGRRLQRFAPVLLVLAAAVHLLILAPAYHLLTPYSTDPFVPQVNLEEVKSTVGQEGVIFSRLYGGRLKARGVRAANWSRAGAVAARQLVRDLLARGWQVYLLENEQFAVRGRLWLGGNVTPLPSPGEGAFFYRVGLPLPGLPIPMRRTERSPAG